MGSPLFREEPEDWKWAHADLSSHKTESGARVQLSDGELSGLSKALGSSQKGGGGWGGWIFSLYNLYNKNALWNSQRHSKKTH